MNDSTNKAELSNDLRSAILAADDLARETVPVPEWNMDIIIQGLTGTARDEYETEATEVTYDLEKAGKIKEIKRVGNTRARLLVRCIVDKRGLPVFSAEDVAELGKKSGRVFDRLFEVAARLSGIRVEDIEEAKGNSEGAHSGAPLSELPKTSDKPLSVSSPQ